MMENKTEEIYISKSKLNRIMYHKAFETDSDLQKWNSGCWIRYKMFEQAMQEIQPENVTKIIRCKHCNHNKTHAIIAEPYSNYCPKLDKVGLPDTFYCAFGENNEEKTEEA